MVIYSKLLILLLYSIKVTKCLSLLSQKNINFCYVVGIYQKSLLCDISVGFSKKGIGMKLVNCHKQNSCLAKLTTILRKANTSYALTWLIFTK